MSLLEIIGEAAAIDRDIDAVMPWCVRHRSRLAWQLDGYILRLLCPDDGRVEALVDLKQPRGPAGAMLGD